jgi:hypothetical protein
MIAVAVLILLSYFGINVTALTAALGIGGLAYGTDSGRRGGSSSKRFGVWRACCPTDRWTLCTTRWAIRP